MKYITITFAVLLFNYSLSQKVISYKKNGIEGVIFTKEYFKNNIQNFTPLISDIDRIEFIIKNGKENLTNFYRQYIGIVRNEREIVIQFFPKDKIEKEYKTWRKNYIYSQDDINIRYAYYNLKTKKLEIMPKEKFSG